MSALRDRFRGALLGLAVGDAVGTTVEFSTPGTFEPVRDMVGGGPFRLPAGAWTDDTSMALCLAESLVERRVFDPVDQLERYVRWYREGYWSSTGQCFDIGNATRAALERFERTREPYPGDAAPDAAGNGPLMKLAPVVLAYASRPEEAERYAGLSARTTHGALEAVDACRAFARLLLGALHGEVSRRSDTALHPKVVAALASMREPPAVRGGGYVIDALEAALWALRTTRSFEAGVLAAVNLGDDADTTAAIYGQLAGAIHGLDGIPERWRERVHRGEEIVALADALYDLNRSRPAIARFAPIRPRRVVECETPEQVAAAVMAGGELAVRGGGHCFAGRSSTSGTLIDVGPMHHVRLEGERATIGAGARLGAIYDALAEHGRTIVAGCGPTVGIAGLTLGGGIGVLGRRYGLTCDRLVSARVVLADGRIVHTDDHPELLWALKGAGGGRFGVVTELTFDTLPAPRTTVFDIRVERTPEVVAEWQRWAPYAPDALAASLLVVDDGAHVFGAYAGPREEAERELERFGGAATLEELDFRAAKQWLADNGPDDGRERPFSRSGLFTAPIAPPLTCKLDFMPLGGAFNRVAADATAYPHRDALFCLHVEAGDQATVDGIMDALPFVGVYPNFPEPERPMWDPVYHRGNRERLLALRATYDPHGVFSPPP
jgi:ADP-ribosyl-[dinitrogen reductase] hydrolase